MDFALNEEQRRWQDEARHFAKEVLLPASLRRDQLEGGSEPWDWEIIKQGSKLGFRTFAVPKNLGGHGADFVTQGIVMAELAKADSAMSKAFSQNWKWSHLIAEFCTKEQKDRFLTPFLADDTYVIGSASTEPNSGSDNRYPPGDKSSGFRLKSTKNTKDNNWTLNGDKCFIANGPVGKLFFINSRSDSDVVAREGTTVFMVPVGTPGFRIGKIFNKAGWRFYQNAELIFENAQVPNENIVGEVNKGQKVRSGMAAEFSDFELASNALGICEAATEYGHQFAKKEKKRGKLLWDHQLVQLKIHEMMMLTETLRSYVMRAAWEMDNKVHGTLSPVLVMAYASDVLQRVTKLNLDVHGAAGGMIDAMAQKLVRDGIIWTHLAGDTTQRLKVLRRLP